MIIMTIWVGDYIWWPSMNNLEEKREQTTNATHKMAPSCNQTKATLVGHDQHSHSCAIPTFKRVILNNML